MESVDLTPNFEDAEVKAPVNVTGELVALVMIMSVDERYMFS